MLKTFYFCFFEYDLPFFYACAVAAVHFIGKGQKKGMILFLEPLERQREKGRERDEEYEREAD